MLVRSTFVLGFAERGPHDLNLDFWTSSVWLIDAYQK